MDPFRVLGLVDPSRREALKEVAERVPGLSVELASGMKLFLERWRHERWQALYVSLSVETVEMRLVERLVEEGRGEALLVSTPTPSVELALEGERLGAVAVLGEPVSTEDLIHALRPLVEERTGISVPEEPSEEAREKRIVATSRQMAEVFQIVARAGPTPATVLITGESGTGKELVAQAIHRASPRRDAPFVAVNCAAIPEHLLEAELFGHEKGAFTGATGRTEGRFGRANGGTLFLDEIGDMGGALQAKILRALEGGEIERLGSDRAVHVDVRVVAATNRPLEEDVESGGFRRDLYYRLAVVRIDLAPLRARPEDIHALALHFVRHFAERYGRPIRTISDAAWNLLEVHSWPGNVRELRNVLDRAVLLARGDTIRARDLRLGEEAPHASPRGGARGWGHPPTVSLKQVEAQHIREVLEYTRGHMGRAAEILGVHRNTMTAKVREYGIESSGRGAGE